jgi:uncharacterized protein YjdB
MTLAACTGDDPDPSPLGPSETIPLLAVEPAAAALKVGESLQFRATGSIRENAAGLFVTQWTSSDPRVAQVSLTGLVTAVGPGSAAVIVSRAGVSATARVSVADGGR